MRSHRSRLAPLAAFAACLAFGTSAVAAEAGKKVTVLFTGDNGGEVAPCG